MALTYVTVTGTFPGEGGQQAVFTPSAVLVDTTDAQVIPANPVKVTLDGAGHFSQLLLSTGNIALSPVGGTGFWFWTFAGLPGVPSFSFFLPLTPSTVDITALINSPAAGGGGGGGITPPAGDLGGTTGTPTVVATHLAAALPLAQGGTGITTSSGVSPYAGLLFGGVWGYPWQFDPLDPDYGAKGDLKIIGDAAVAGGALTTLTSASAAFTSADTGKKIMLNGGQGNNAQPLISTITFVNSTTVTLANAASGALTNASACYGTDDTAAINACLSAAGTWAQAHGWRAQILFTQLHAAATAPGVASGNSASTTCQIKIPRPALSGATQALHIDLLGLGAADANQYWIAAVPQIPAPGIVSMCIPAYSAGTNPYPSVIGFEYAADGTMTGGFANTKVHVDGLTVAIPFLGPQGAYDFRFCKGAGGGRFSAMSFSAVNGAYNNLPALNTLGGQQGGSSVGLYMPLTGNNDDCTIASFANEGFTYGITATEHCSFQRWSSIYDVVGMQLVGGGAHIGTTFPYATAELCLTALQYTGASAFPVYGVLDTEQIGTWHVQDTQNALYGQLVVHTNSGSPPAVQGASNCEILYDLQSRTVQAAPSYSLGTAFQNPWWRGMEVRLSGGTTTGVLIGPTSATATTSVGTTTPVNFKLPSGWWLNIQGSVKPTGFVAVPT